ncbi:flavin-nucleotide-binding protein [Wilcoxina mikolae CBS 423.85]|nr:flavin-nucleotide-binding protein [Wilcoxina mikolae CBS 423.85]
MPRHELFYPKTANNKVNRYAPLAKYDATTIHTIINSVPVLHVSFLSPSDPPLPVILPYIGRLSLPPLLPPILTPPGLGSFTNPSAGPDEAQDLYLHGYVSSRLFRPSPQGSINLCVAATIVDGFVLALTPYNHTYNYRSAILHGTATLVSDPDEKLYVMRLITEGVMPGRWEGSRVPPKKAELESTGILKMTIESASAKVRAGGPGGERGEEEEVKERVWTGVVPTWMTHGEPVEAGGNRVQMVPEYVKEAVSAFLLS